MVNKNINHFANIHIRSVDSFERSFMSDYIDVDFYKLLCSLADGVMLYSDYSKDILENFKSKYSVGNIEEFIKSFSAEINSKNSTDLRTVLFYILSKHTEDILKESYSERYLIDERGLKTSSLNTIRFDKEVLDVFYNALLDRMENNFDYKTAAMILQCPYIFFDNFRKSARGARLFKELLNYVKSSAMPVEEFIYCCYSCIEYINYACQKANEYSPEVVDDLEEIKKKGCEIIGDLIGAVDLEIYKIKNPLVYFMLIKLIESIGGVSVDFKNYEVISNILNMRLANISDDNAEEFEALNVSKEIIKHVKFLYIISSDEQVDYVEYMRLKEEIEYLYEVRLEEAKNEECLQENINVVESSVDANVDTNQSVDTGQEEVCAKEAVQLPIDVVLVKEDVSLGSLTEGEIIELSQEVSLDETKNEEILQENNNVIEANVDVNVSVSQEDVCIQESVQLPLDGVINEENTVSVAQNSLYEALLAMQKAKEEMNLQLNSSDSNLEENVSVDSSINEYSNESFTFTWI